MKFKALQKAMTAAIITTAGVAIMVAAAERSLTAAAEAADGTLAQVQEDVAARG